MKKILGLSSLALAGVLAFTGCGKDKAELDIEKTNAVINEMQDYLNQQKEKTLRDSSAQIFSKRMKDLAILAVDYNNYTLVEDNKVTRVEYTSSELTKVYHYTLNENNEKVNEIYREIGTDYVYTYVKDVGLYSKVPSSFADGDKSLVGFNSGSDIAVYDHEESKTWSWYIPTYDNYIIYSGNAYEQLFKGVKIPADEIETNFEYESNGDSDIFKDMRVILSNAGYDEQNFQVYEDVIEFTDNSFSVTTMVKTVREGLPEAYLDIDDTSFSKSEVEYTLKISFDKENTIDFVKTGYELVE